MNGEIFRYNLQVLNQQLAALEEQQVALPWEEMTAALENLQLIYEEMQTSLATAEIVEQELLQQNQRITTAYQHYYDLFQAAPIAYLITDATGLILEANPALAQLLNVPHRYIKGKPLAVYIAQSDRKTFRTKLNQLSAADHLQCWQMILCPRGGQPFMAEFTVAIARNHLGWIEKLHIVIYKISQYQQVDQPEVTRDKLKTPVPSLPQSLDGLQVLVVDDEADARDFIAAVLESRGIRVTAVANAAAALEILETFQPDVLVCDIRMPGADGYALIRQIRALEAKKGWHIPAAAFTAYLDENREKALKSGFEAHLPKLAQPDKLIETIAQLAGYTSNPEKNSSLEGEANPKSTHPKSKIE